MLSNSHPTPAEPDARKVDDWMVVVPTRGDPASAARIEDNIVGSLDRVPVLVIRNDARCEKAAWASLDERPNVEILDRAGGGVARARNAALFSGTTRTLVFVDDDVVVSHSALRTLVVGQRAAGATVATARVISADAAHHALFDSVLGFDRGHHSRTWRASAGADSPLSPLNVWQFGVGATFAIDLSLLGTAGDATRFDERLSNGRFCGGSEDVDFFYAIYLAGHTIAYVAEAVVKHLFPLSSAAVSAKCRQYALSDGAFYAKWARHVSASDVRGEVCGWWGRIARRSADHAADRPVVPMPCLLAEPLYKLLGGVTWALVLRRSS